MSNISHLIHFSLMLLQFDFLGVDLVRLTLAVEAIMFLLPLVVFLLLLVLLLLYDIELFRITFGTCLLWYFVYYGFMRILACLHPYTRSLLHW